MAGNVLWTTIFNKPTSQASELTRQRIVQEERCGRRPASIISGPAYEDAVRGRGPLTIADPWAPPRDRHALPAPIKGYGGTMPRVRQEHTGKNYGEQAAQFKCVPIPNLNLVAHAMALTGAFPHLGTGRTLAQIAISIRRIWHLAVAPPRSAPNRCPYPAVRHLSGRASMSRCWRCAQPTLSWEKHTDHSRSCLGSMHLRMGLASPAGYPMPRLARLDGLPVVTALCLLMIESWKCANAHDACGARSFTSTTTAPPC